MNIKDYEYIVEIATQGNISKAADRLCITPGALSKFLIRLENELNIQLFKRMGNQLMLTQAGKRYVELGTMIIKIDEELTNDIEDMAKSGDASLHIGSPRGMIAFILNTLLPEFYKRRPNSKISLEGSSSADMVKALEDGKIDLCFAYAPEKKPNLKYTRLAHVSTVLAVPYTSPLLEKATVKENYPYPVLEDDSWIEEPFIELPKITLSRKLADKFFAPLEKKPNVRFYAPDTSTALLAVESGIGNCLLLALPNTGKRVKLLNIQKFIDNGADLFAITRKNDFQSTDMDILLKIAKELYSKIDY